MVFASLSYIYWQYIDSLILIDINSFHGAAKLAGSNLSLNYSNNASGGGGQQCFTYTHKNLSLLGYYHSRIHQSTYTTCFQSRPTKISTDSSTSSDFNYRQPQIFVGFILMLLWSFFMLKYAIYVLSTGVRDLLWCRRQRSRKVFADCDLVPNRAIRRGT